MYLEHFGLDSPPFKITPVTHFFFSGANRGEILDALIYAITESEGIIKVTGEVGSGKTMLCRMLLERLPPQLENVYLANPSLSREEMLYAIADGLGLNLEGQRVNVIMQTLQNLLEQKATEGKRVVILVDEAHAMPLETLEELRLLYNLQLGDHKLLQIVLFGQPELNEKLNQPNMRQLKDRIVHHFTMLPLSKNVIESYLLFRMRTAGYRGPNIFSEAAVNLIGTASNGLMRRVNILANKSLLSAFIENTHNIEVRHVQAAIQDSDMPTTGVRVSHNFRWTGVIGAGALVLALAGLGWYVSTISSKQPSSNLAPATPLVNLGSNNPASNPLSNSDASNSNTSNSNPAPTELSVSVVAVAPLEAATSSAVSPTTAPTSGATNSTPPPPPVTPAPTDLPPLLTQRLAAGVELFAKRTPNSASIQLFYTTERQSDRMEAFLKRAQALGKIAEIYIQPTRINGKDGYRVLYGNYPNPDAARSGIKQLPQRYKDGFTPGIFLLNSAALGK